MNKNHEQTLSLLTNLAIGSSPSPAPTMPSSPINPTPSIATESVYTPSQASPSTSVFPFLYISSLATSILPSTPPTQPGLMLSTPTTSLSHPSIPINLSPLSTSSSIMTIPNTSPPSSPTLPSTFNLTSLHANLARHPFIGILLGAITKVFMAPQPLNFLPPPLPSTSLFTPINPYSCNPTPALVVPPLSTLLASVPQAPSPSSIPHPSSLSFTLHQTSTSLSTAAPTFSLFTIIDPSSSTTSFTTFTSAP